MQNCHIKHTPLFSMKYGGKYIFTLMTLNVKNKGKYIISAIKWFGSFFSSFSFSKCTVMKSRAVKLNLKKEGLEIFFLAAMSRLA